MPASTVFPFRSVMRNLIAQVLLALKAQLRSARAASVVIPDFVGWQFPNRGDTAPSSQTASAPHATGSLFPKPNTKMPMCAQKDRYPSSRALAWLHKIVLKEFQT